MSKENRVVEASISLYRANQDVETTHKHYEQAMGRLRLADKSFEDAVAAEVDRRLDAQEMSGE